MAGLQEIHFLPVLSTGCQASCSYCFGPRTGKTVTPAGLTKMVDYISAVSKATGQKKTRITFHGGEPLLADTGLWTLAFAEFGEKLTHQQIRYSLQSNLWNLDPTLCRLFSENGVSLGTSLDGPEAINGRQRGSACFRRTFRGIQLAASYGLSPGIIATFTPLNAKKYREVFSFFLRKGLSFSVHPCVDTLDRAEGRYTLSPEAYGDLLVNLLELYIPNRHNIMMPTLDQMILSFVEEEGQVCTFRECFGMFLAVCPDGYLYSCQRFAEKTGYALGNIADNPSPEELFTSPVARKMIQHQERIRELCGDCAYHPFCHGGCLYNAWSSGREKDPYCPAYKRIFGFIQEQLVQEMASVENRAALISEPRGTLRNPLLRKGALIELTRKNQHPVSKRKNAEAILTLVELAKNNSIRETAASLNNRGIRVTGERLRQLQASLKNNRHALNNLYLHLTYKCQLCCTHCYANSGSTAAGFFEVSALEKVIREARDARFRQLVITGGEPLLHPETEKINSLLASEREKGMTLLLVLRSNFAKSMESGELESISRAYDKIIVSLDGDEEKHDARRGKGSYAATTANVKRYQQLFRNDRSKGELTLACVTGHRELHSPAVHSLLAFARENHISQVRFRPVLPIGRAKENFPGLVSEALSSFTEPDDILALGYTPVSSCGIGQNLYVHPDGKVFPCYAYPEMDSFLGNLQEEGLNTILDSEKFRSLSKHTVDTNLKCRSCRYRYLCGGACRAWDSGLTRRYPDAPPPDCSGLYERAEEIYRFAVDYLAEQKLIT